MNKFDLEERMIEFSVLIIEITREMPNNYAANHLAKQLLRSGTSVSLNYGEAQSGESRKDFVHKLKIVLKEWRETYINLKIIQRTKLYKTQAKIEKAKQENNELISILVKSIETAQKNMKGWKNHSILNKSKIANRCSLFDILPVFLVLKSKSRSQENLKITQGMRPYSLWSYSPISNPLY